MILKHYILLLTILVLVGCGDVTTESEPITGEMQMKVTTVTLSGSVTYDAVPFKSGGGSGLDYNNITKKPVRGAIVEIVNGSGSVLKTTTTDENGAYAVEVTGTNVKVRVSAKLYKAPILGQSSWDFQVKDNTNSNALYAMEGSLAGLGSNDTQIRNLNAPSGWGGSAYIDTRVAGPFAILDVVYSAIDKLTAVEKDIVFPPLNIFWSKNNVPLSGNKSLGQIGTSHYNFVENAFYILGSENSDTDEYDSAVVAHEWSHYYEYNFSRTDTIGGPHATGDRLDIRLAFGEGFATTMGNIIIESSLYLDSGKEGQAQNIAYANLEEGGKARNPGWYSEASIYHLLYDIYDSQDDEGDRLSLGLGPIHNALITTQKNTEAFTSIFTFITALKAEVPQSEGEIDAITNNESIASIVDVYGSGRTNRGIENANPLYADLKVGGSVIITPDYSAKLKNRENWLGIYNFIKFTIPTAGTYTINARSTSGVQLNFAAYREGSRSVAISSSSTGSSVSGSAYLDAGIYRMSIMDSNLVSGQRFIVTLN